MSQETKIKEKEKTEQKEFYTIVIHDYDCGGYKNFVKILGIYETKEEAITDVKLYISQIRQKEFHPEYSKEYYKLRETIKSIETACSVLKDKPELKEIEKTRDRLLNELTELASNEVHEQKMKYEEKINKISDNVCRDLQEHEKAYLNSFEFKLYTVPLKNLK